MFALGAKSVCSFSKESNLVTMARDRAQPSRHVVQSRISQRGAMGLCTKNVVLLAALLAGSECTRGPSAEVPALRWGEIYLARLGAACLRPSVGRNPAPLALRGGGEAQKTLSFSVVCDSTQMGEDVGIVGECHELGKWRDVVRLKAGEVSC
jgi:hypothetical protein